MSLVPVLRDLRSWRRSRMCIVFGVVAAGCAVQSTDSSVDSNETVLLDSCEPGFDVPVSPLTVLDAVNLYDETMNVVPTIHLVDVAYDADRELIYGVGTGGLFVFREEGEKIQYLGARTVGQLGSYRDAFHKVTPLKGTDYVAVTSRERGLYIVLVDDEGSTETVFGYEAANFSGMAASGERLYLLSHIGELLTFDISNPGAPQLLSTLDELGNPWAIELAGDYAYVADNTLGLVTLELANPDQPVISSVQRGAGGAQDLSVLGNVVYAAIGSLGVQVFDLDDPSQPKSVGVTDVGRSAIAISAAPGLLWVATQEGVVVLNIDSPLQPMPGGAVKTTEWAMNVTAFDDEAWIADWSWLSRLEFDSSKRAPAADFTPDFLYLDDESPTTTLSITNRGGGDLRVHGLRVSDSRIRPTLDQSVVSPGQSANLTLTLEGDGLPVEAELCVSSNDPLDPIRTVEVASSSSMTRVALGEPAHDFVLQDLDGATHRLSDQIGKPVVLAYFATW